jgi:LmbE family N-acetylglucosaminyl deacetylase
VTDGAPRNEQDSRAHGFASLREYRRARQEELREALRRAGLPNANRECLDISDQEASFCLFQLTRRIYQLLKRSDPEVVITHAYEGGHPDHDASAFAVHHAVALRRKQNEQYPLIVEGALYHAGPDGIATGSFLPHPRSMQEVLFKLSPEERMRKEALLACFSTQQETLRYFTLECERFRIAPEYDFRKPPHPAPVFYDRYAWGMTSQHFCELVREAENLLQEETAGACR